MSIDALFPRAVTAIEAGDVPELERLLSAHPELVRERLESPGTWLRESVGDALEGYFRHPYLLWFIAENPIRTGRVPANIADVTRALVAAANRERVDTLQEQLDYALELVCTGRIVRELGFQIQLIDLLVDAGANPGSGYGALANRNLAAAQRLIERGGEPTLAAALCLGRTDDVTRLARVASAEDRQIALTAAALNGNAEALRTLVGLEVDVKAYSLVIHPHATPLHHAVWSGSLDAVKVLVEAGADLTLRDKVYHSTPLGWAEYAGRDEIAAYLMKEGSPT
ncbi:MAG TPA: ankyrin repeat domain-containing protein [Gemmatimonadota bacterium]|nr:ankyrin repeat domain-containing protein [Gemmatimonadota bacterium]